MKAAIDLSLVIVFAAAPCLGGSRSAAAQSSARCSVNPVDVPRRPTKLDGTVVGTITADRVRVLTKRVEKETGARISPDYADLPRIVARVVTSGQTFETIAAVVDGHIPRPGDRVGLLSRYRDPRSPCDFIPWTIRGLDAVS